MTSKNGNTAGGKETTSSLFGAMTLDERSASRQMEKQHKGGGGEKEE